MLKRPAESSRVLSLSLSLRSKLTLYLFIARSGNSCGRSLSFPPSSRSSTEDTLPVVPSPTRSLWSRPLSLSRPLLDRPGHRETGRVEVTITTVEPPRSTTRRKASSELTLEMIPAQSLLPTSPLPRDSLIRRGSQCDQLQSTAGQETHCAIRSLTMEGG
jgi:hypothetical protein